MTKKTTLPATLVAPPTTKGKPVNTPQTRTLQQLATVWNAMNGVEQSTWNNLAGQMSQPGELGLPGKVGAYALFVQHGITQMNAGGEPQTTAPAARVPATPLPPLMLDNNYEPGSLILSIISSAPYAGRIIVYAARPVLAGYNTYKKSAFKVIGSLPSLSVGINPIGQLYSSKFRVPSAGYEIAVKLVGVTPGGFRTNQVFASTVVVAPADTRQSTVDDTVLKVA